MDEAKLTKINVKKASGDFERFSISKLKHYLQRIQLPNEIIDSVLEKSASNLQSDSTTTTQITQEVTKVLRDLPQGDTYCARYNIKPNIRKFGPDGHTFEIFVGRLFEKEGFKVRTGVDIHGKCATHEVDVIASRKGEEHFVECKFHNREGIRSDVTVAMYTYARFLDIEEEHKQIPHNHQGWLATNTKLSKDAFKYAICKGMKLLNVEFPEQDGIMERVIRHKAYPVTTITELEPHFRSLFNNGMVLVEDVLNLGEIQAEELGIPLEVFSKAQEKAHKIMI